MIACVDGDTSDELRDRWSHLYRSHLPALAKARDPVQRKWPVFLDHCFARIVLDNAIGVDRPWTEAVKSPAVKNMTIEQLQDVVALGEKLATGEADLVELDTRSLRLRGKASKGAGKTTEADGIKASRGKKRKAESTISQYFAPSPASPDKRQKQDGLSKQESSGEAEPTERYQDSDRSVQLARIASSKTLTPFRKQTLSLLCLIPRGRYSTYQALSDHITVTSHKTCARAVGNAMRNNPFAPEVPCHRILAADGSLGGFGGDWGENGKHAGKKRQLLEEEGVKFDSRGKVKGNVFWEFDG